MPKKIISDDSFKQWRINGDNLTWTLEQQAKITVNDEDAVNVLATSTGNTVRLLGDIDASGDFGRGALVSGADTRIVIGAKSSIDAYDGIRSTVGGFHVVNRGEIHAVDTGITSSDDANIRNFGKIEADLGIGVDGSSKVVNGRDGMIQGDTTGVLMGYGPDATLVNHGQISANFNAVHMFTGDNTLVNTGTILGDILFGSGNDLLDSSRGIIQGEVTGGDGNDIYKLGNNNVDIEEELGGGHDSVYSRVSHSLDNYVENLYLVGKSDASGFANDWDNIVTGNKGDNTLSGRGGDDYLGGGRGNDVMNGDEGSDVLMFNRGDDHDAITGFDKGEDVIWMTGFEGVTTFAQLQSHISQHGDDVWISMGQGDRLVIYETDADTLEAEDFSFLTL